MRALLVLPLIALAASIAIGAPRNRSDDELNSLVMDLENAADALANEAEAAASNDLMTDEAALAPMPGWVSQGSWATVGPDESGSFWYLEQARSKFEIRPLRALIRVDHAQDSTTPYIWTERTAEIDCRRHLYRILRTTHEDRAGRRSESDERSGGRFVPVIDGNIFQGVEQLACSLTPGSDGIIMNAM